MTFFRGIKSYSWKNNDDKNMYKYLSILYIKNREIEIKYWIKVILVIKWTNVNLMFNIVIDYSKKGKFNI